MNFDIKRVAENKKKFRRNLADRPIAEKLEMLDQLRERAVVIRDAVKPSAAVVVQEKQSLYGSKKQKP